MKKISVILLSLALLTSCVDSLDDYNVDPKKAQTVTAETLFSAALKNFADALTTPSVNTNNFRLYVQHWTTTTYLDEPRYNLTSRTIPQSFWDFLYRDVLSDLKEARRIIEADQFIAPGIKNNQLAQIGIIEVYAWSVLVNTFGDIPYSQALDINNSLPEYDEAHTIYLNLLDRLDAALPLITTNVRGFEGGDLIYNNKTAPADRMTAWRKFGNSLKLKLAMTLVKSPGDHDRVLKAVTEATAGNNALLFASNADNARFPYISDPPNNNPVATNLNASFTSREDFISANTLVNYMNSVEDPRRPFFFGTVQVDTTAEGDPVMGYKGGLYGFANDYKLFSKISTKVIAANFEALLLDYAEIQFFLAEAVERELIAGSAETYYNNAITASITYWGGAAPAITTYLARPEVDYETAAGDFEEKIGRQKWIALYNRGYDAWTEWRRLDAPALSPPTGENVPQLFLPLRLIYPISEQTLNGSNREIAVSRMTGGDISTSPLFWDR